MEAVRTILLADPVWAVYGLADLQPAFAPHCQWFVAGAGQQAGLALLYTGLAPTILLTAGAPGAVAEAFVAAPHPDAVYLSIREEHEPVVQRWYDNSGDRRRMWRMVLGGARGEGRGATAEGRGARGEEQEAFRLGPGDAARIMALYAVGGPFTPDAFDPYQLDDGVFYGVEAADGELVAVGGTHIVDWAAGVGAIGNMYTHPTHRGRGHAGAVLAGIVAELHRGAVQTIILNVDQRNDGARRLYKQHGFVIHCPYIEGVATLKGKK